MCVAVARSRPVPTAIFSRVRFLLVCTPDHIFFLGCDLVPASLDSLITMLTLSLLPWTPSSPSIFTGVRRFPLSPIASEAGRLMRVATPSEVIDSALQEALGGMKLSQQQQAAALTLQRRLELTPAETVRLLLSHPHVLDYSYNCNLEATLDLLQAMLGLSHAELAKMMRACPFLLSLSKSDVLIERVDELRDLFHIDALELGRIVVRFPRLLTLNVERKVRPTALALREVLRLEEEDLNKLIHKHPQVLSLHVEKNVQPTLAVLRKLMELDHAQLRMLVLKLPQALGLSAETNLRPKLCFLADSLSLSPSELREAVMRDPLVLGSSLNKSLRPNVDAWHEELCEHPAGDLKKFAEKYGLRWLTASYERRTQPRLERLRQVGIDAIELIPRIRMKDEDFEKWIDEQELAAELARFRQELLSNSIPPTGSETRQQARDRQ